MPKDRSFASKVAKSQHLTAAHCPQCGEIKNTLKTIQAFKSEKADSYKFKEKFVPICKCNEKELLS